MSETVQPPPPDKPPPSFGGLAKKIRGRTSDLLAIAIVVIGGLAVGRQVSRWWDKPDDPAADARNNTAGPAAAFGDGNPVTLDFGKSPYSMVRTVAHGDRTSATRQLVDECRKIAVTTPFPSHPPPAAETKLLTRVTAEKPLQEGTGWRLYRVDGPLTMVSVVRSQTATPADANPAPRVVCWGLAFPAGETRWVLYRFVSADGEASASDAAEVPLPASVTPLLAVRGRDHSWRTFRSRERVDSVRAFYIDWFRENGWSETASSGAWTAAFAKGTLRAEVQISRDGRRGCTGVIVVTGTKVK